MTKTPAKSWLPAFVLSGVIWGLSFLFIKVGLESATPMGVAVSRGMLGAATLVLWSLVTRRKFVRGWHLWKHILVLGFLLNAFPSLMFSFAEATLPSNLAGILNATTPLTTALCVMFIFRGERLTGQQVAGLLIGFGGVVVLSGQLGHFELATVPGVLMLLAATTSYGIGFPYTRKFLSNTGYSATSLATAQLIATAAWMTPVALTTPMTVAPLTPAAIWSLLVLGALGTGFAYIWNFRTIALAGSAIASTVTYITPVVAVLAGWLVLGELPHWYVLAGALLILLSAAMVQKRIRLPRGRATT
ncbi:MAG: DMT family transporter [Micrococcales bacterium]